MKRTFSWGVLVLVGCGGPTSGSEGKAPIVVAVNDAAAPVEPAKEEPAKEPDDAERARVKAQIEKTAQERDRIEAMIAQTPGGDPANGTFGLAEATAGLATSGPIHATIRTSMGDMKCKLFDDKAPIAVANFVGLARGLRPFKDPASGQWVKRPAYDNTSFHRVISGFMIQGGDPKGDGTGEPGYVIPDEVWPGAKHDRPGLLCEANRGPNTNGMQFFITDGKAPHLDSGYTIFGECAPVSVVNAIGKVPKDARDRPNTPVTIKTIEITRTAPATRAKP